MSISRHVCIHQKITGPRFVLVSVSLRQVSLVYSNLHMWRSLHIVVTVISVRVITDSFQVRREQNTRETE
jgi:hypothetical protein